MLRWLFLRLLLLRLISSYFSSVVGFDDVVFSLFDTFSVFLFEKRTLHSLSELVLFFLEED